MNFGEYFCFQIVIVYYVLPRSLCLSSSLPARTVTMMSGVQFLTWALGVVAVTSSSDPAPLAPVLRLELTASQMQTLQLYPSTFYFVCQLDPTTASIHSSSLVRNNLLELVPFERLNDGVSDCRALGAQHSDESSSVVQYRQPDTGRRQERELTPVQRRQDKDGWRVGQSEGRKAERESGSGQAWSQGWSGLATEVVIQSLFNLGILIMTAAARAGWLGDCGHRLVTRLMEGRPMPAGQTSSAPLSPAQTPDSRHSGPSRGTVDREEVELEEICVDRGARSLVGESLPV